MKKIITVLSLFTGLISNAQYVKHQKIVVDVSAGYAVSLSLDRNNDKTNFNVDNMHGLTIDASAFYRLGFNSMHMVGLKTTYIKGTSSSDIFGNFGEFGEYESNQVQKKYSTFFIGPSYRMDLTSFTGKFSSSLSITPGFSQIVGDLTSTKGEATVKATGFGIGLSAVNSRRIFESFDWLLRIGFNYSNYSKFKTENSGSQMIVNSFDNVSFHVIRGELTTGFSYKF
ncbi:hypothetical protein [Flavobacterium sp. I3-2]|uniref:hypothetical protein n=1 Tax=Flavobacterium sp. I3-2 TaxID=2748319 RepID=UPI0015AD8365|nr:hypothetical protein [Flavobacterium sp. I3-2]